MNNSTPKKRKSNTNIDAIAGGVQRGPKMERYKLDELEKQMEGESSQQQAVNRRGSIIGAVGSLLKKIKSTSTLKNPESARHSFASTGSSSVFAFPDPDALDKDDGGSEFSFESGSSTGSIDPELLERCEKNKLLRRVLNGEERAMSSAYSQPGTQVSASLESTGSSTASDSVSGVSLESYSSITTGSAVGLEMDEKEGWESGKMLPPPLPRSTPGTPHRISMAAFCTPKRPSSRYSMKSAPGAILDGQGNGTGQNEPDSGSLVDNGTSLIRGLCNSVRRTHSSMSDIRLHRKPSSARRRKHLVSMADLPEEEQENHDSDKKKSTEVPKMPGGVTTPISPLGRRQSIWSKLGSGSGKRRNSLDAVSPMLMEQVSFSTSTSVALDQEKIITPSSTLSATRGIGSSSRKKSSSSFSRFLQGFRKGSTSTTNSAGASMSSRDKTPTSTGDTIVLKRRPTIDQKYGMERRMSKYRIPNNEQAPSSSSYMEPSYHNRSLFHKSSSASMQEKRAKAKVFLSVFTVADKPILELLSDQNELDKFDAIAVDVTVEGYPVSSTANAIVSEGEVRDQLHKLAMTHPNKNGFYVRVGGPDLLYVMAHNTGSGEGDAVRCMRVGVFAALKELFSTNHIRKKLLLYPLFCSTSSDMDEQLLRHFIQTCNLVIREVDVGSKGYSVVLTGLDRANTDAFQQMFLAMSKEMKELLDEDEGQHDESMTGRSTASSASDMTDPFSTTAEATDL